MTTIAQRYRLERVLGRGGMGEVWLAEDTVLGRQVAAKRVGAVGVADSGVDQAQREARMAAMLAHEHVVQVFDLAVDDGDQWLVMELVEAENLAARVRRTGPLDPTSAARLIHQTAQALAAAHAAGIVHRDVKPSNLLVTPGGHVKLADFGIARLEADAGHTRTGQMVGSPSYLAPEIATGSSASPASDLWSLGATLYHAVEGHPPYDAADGNVVGTLYRIVNDPPPSPTRAGWTDSLVRHLMVHDPASRWTAEQVVTYLGSALANAPAVESGRLPTEPPSPPLEVRPVDPVAPTDATTSLPARGARRTPARPAPAARRRRPVPWSLVAAALAVVLLVGGVVALMLRDRGATPPAANARPSASSSASATPKTATATAAGMRTFIEDYLRTAPDDPAKTFDRLTPGFQRSSNGLDGYRGFWGTVASARPSRIQADPKALTLSYDVAYEMRDGTRRNENVRLQLAYADGSYLISGEPR